MDVPNDRFGTVIVTGAGGGLGRAITARLISDGYDCVIADLNKQALVQTIAAVEGMARRPFPVVCDLRTQADREQLIEEAVAHTGGLYGLVNNAGFSSILPFFDENENDWRISFEVNLEAPFFLSQAAARHMKGNPPGRIVNIASVYGVMALNNEGYGDRAPLVTPGDRGPVRHSAYVASKGGLLSLTRDLAAALGPWGITVNAISPGSVPHGVNAVNQECNPDDALPLAAEKRRKPGLGDKVDPAILRALAKQVPLQRLGRPEEIAGPVSFLLSSDASYVTGQNLVVDGGWSIW